MENLEALVKLEDLSLYHNQIDTIEGLSRVKTLPLSVGENKIKHLESFDPLRALTALRRQLRREPVCDERTAPYVLTHTRARLDHRLVARGCGEGQGPVLDELAELEAKEEARQRAKRRRSRRGTRARPASASPISSTTC